MVFVSSTGPKTNTKLYLSRFNKISDDRHIRVNTDDRHRAYVAWSKVGKGRTTRILITPLVPGVAAIDVLFFIKNILQTTVRLKVEAETVNLPRIRKD